MFYKETIAEPFSFHFLLGAALLWAVFSLPVYSQTHPIASLAQAVPMDNDNTLPQRPANIDTEETESKPRRRYQKIEIFKDPSLQRERIVIRPEKAPPSATLPKPAYIPGGGGAAARMQDDLVTTPGDAAATEHMIMSIPQTE